MTHTRRIRAGGMLECCVEAIESNEDTPDAEGQRITCECGAVLVFRHGAWEFEVTFEPAQGRVP